MSWILTRSSVRFNLLAPTAAMVRPIDIAHALGHLCRFNGHTSHHYSVAQHSMLVADLAPQEDQLAALLHDAAEAYVGDMVRPLKDLLPEYDQIEKRVWYAICDRFMIDPTLPRSIKEADMIALATERRDLMPDTVEQWECLRDVKPHPERIYGTPALLASDMYFRRLMELMQTTHRLRAQA